MINTASVLNINFLELKQDIDALVAGGTTCLHIDVMDGHYVPNLCMPVKFIREIHQAYPQLTLDVHLMVDDPATYIGQMQEAGTDYFCFHTDSTRFVRRTINQIRAAGMKPGITINPSQRIDEMLPYMEYVDMVMLMAVEPGFAGQTLLPGSMERLAEIAELRKRYGCSFLISVDGGIDYEKGHQCKEIGVDMIVGTIHTIFKQPEGITEACRRFKRELG